VDLRKEMLLAIATLLDRRLTRYHHDQA